MTSIVIISPRVRVVHFVAEPRILSVVPTVLRSGPYRLYFYSADGGEPPHVHVERDHNTAKFWLEPVRLDDSGGFSRVEIRRVRAIIEQNVELLLRSWNDFFAG